MLLFLIPATIIFLESRPEKGQRPKTSTNLRLPPPTKIIALRIYPIKSCRGISVTSRKLLKTGLDLDRQWMFADASTMKFLTIRQISKMTLINTAVDEEKDELQISVKKIDEDPDISITIPAHPSNEWLAENTTLTSGEIWGTVTDGYAYSETLTAPFSEFFGREVRLIYKGPTPRLLGGNGAEEYLGRKESTMFADLAPIQVSNAKSMDELNERLKAQDEGEITIERFRPNIVVKGDKPWSEDVWKTLRITGDKAGGKRMDHITLDVSARCARCQVPNVDPDTAEKHKRQPWDTMMKYRRVDEGITFKPCFGLLCVPRWEGKVAVGMDFQVTECTEEHRYVTGM
ncbi:hypothetical protein K402DRAFT_326027 [Aulographum hederae CBS 113979]|uniref:MOSC domain-containing protein n=1 Tax=Aulographum hederae CBS 113979 TaxID=1176131 RepID=A0A6G1H9Q0_9PEZI|nr:hypothetical protein K402DRAFT_326027 [Aulographum hederae CBS 113979]